MAKYCDEISRMGAMAGLLLPAWLMLLMPLAVIACEGDEVAAGVDAVQVSERVSVKETPVVPVASVSPGRTDQTDVQAVSTAADNNKKNSGNTEESLEENSKKSLQGKVQSASLPNRDGIIKSSDSTLLFDMDVLIKRLKQTDAIGVFSKLALRSDALDLMDLVKEWRRHVGKWTLKEVRSRYDGLLLKVLALLNDDPVLSHDISMAREEIWQSLLEVKT